MIIIYWLRMLLLLLLFGYKHIHLKTDEVNENGRCNMALQHPQAYEKIVAM